MRFITPVQNCRGSINILPLAIGIVTLALISFLFISSTVPFKGLLGSLFPKPSSHASVSKDFGVNLSGGEFGQPGTVGSLNRDYLYYVDSSVYNYFSRKGLRLLRIPFTWERVQPQALGQLSSVDIAGLQSILDAAAATNTKVILDLHNFARYYAAPMTTQDSTKFADVWTKLAAQFKNSSALYGYELMNEPHDLAEGAEGWRVMAQAATDAIRQVDTTHYILIPGYGWQSARFWQDNNVNLIINDPTGKLLYSAHQYFDADYSGSYSQSYDASGAYPTIGVDRLQFFLNWLTAHNVRGILTEYGIPNNDSRWNTVLDNFINVLNTNDLIQGGTYWAAGPWWGGYPLSLQPTGTSPNFTDQPQIAIVQKYPSTTSKSYIFGTVQSDDTKAVNDSTAGIKLATLQLAWDQYQPTEASFNQTYISSLRQKIQNFQNAGMQVVLDFGIQYPPGWVLNYPNSHFVNQYGHQFQQSTPGSGENPVNAVFNQTMRDKQENYIKQVFTDLGTSFYGVRLGWGNFGEVGYPPPNFGRDANSYWAFDPIAQNAAGLPVGMSYDPVPGWLPGQPSNNHTFAQSFLNWYLACLKNYHDWQITTVSKYYAGKKTMLYPSWGIRPGAVLSAINDDLNGASGQENTGEVAKGLDFAGLINGITDKNVVVYGTWIDSPVNFGNNDTTSDQIGWSPIHYLAYLAQNNNLQAWGENTGNGDINAMNLSFTRMKQFNLIGLNWAFDKDLYSGGNLATVNNYQNLITQTNGALPSNKPWPTIVPTTTPTSLPSVIPISGNIIQNGSFDNSNISIAPWKWNMQTGANGSANLDTTTKVDGSNSVRLDITQTNQTAWFDQLLQTNIPLNSGQNYTVSFWAKAANSRTIDVALQRNGGTTGSDFTVYTYQTFNITTSWQQFTFNLTPTSSDFGLINFNVANNPSSVWIDGVSLSSSCPKLALGDINCSGRVDLFDYNILVGNFGQLGVGISGGDLNNDGKVDLFDYNILVTNFGK